MKKIKFWAILCIGALCCTSCLRTTYYVGSSRPKEQKMIKVGQDYFHHHYLAGLVAGKNATVAAEEYANNSENFAVRTSINFVDLLIGGVTFNIYTPTKTTWFMSVDEINKQSNHKNTAE